MKSVFLVAGCLVSGMTSTQVYASNVKQMIANTDTSILRLISSIPCKPSSYESNKKVSWSASISAKSWGISSEFSGAEYELNENPFGNRPQRVGRGKSLSPILVGEIESLDIFQSVRMLPPDIQAIYDNFSFDYSCIKEDSIFSTKYGTPIVTINERIRREQIQNYASEKKTGEGQTTQTSTP